MDILWHASFCRILDQFEFSCSSRPINITLQEQETQVSRCADFRWRIYFQTIALCVWTIMDDQDMFSNIVQAQRVSWCLNQVTCQCENLAAWQCDSFGYLKPCQGVHLVEKVTGMCLGCFDELVNDLQSNRKSSCGERMNETTPWGWTCR